MHGSAAVAYTRSYLMVNCARLFSLHAVWQRLKAHESFDKWILHVLATAAATATVPPFFPPEEEGRQHGATDCCAFSARLPLFYNRLYSRGLNIQSILSVLRAHVCPQVAG